MRAMYSSFSSATHHIFFPPRLQFVALKKDADRLPAHLRRQLSLDRFARRSAARSTAPCPVRRRTAHHGDDPLALAYIQRSLFAGPGLFVQCRLQPLLLITPGNGPYRLRATPTFPATCAAVRPWSSWRRIEARRNTRADSRPLVSIAASCCRSFLPNSTCTRW